MPVKSKMTPMIYAKVIYLDGSRISVSGQEYLLRDDKCFAQTEKGWNLCGRLIQRVFCRYDEDIFHSIWFDKKYYINKECVLYRKMVRVGVYNPLTNKVSLEVILKTKRSSFQVGLFLQEDLVKRCVDETEGLERLKSRSTGFFSDSSLGYKYSNITMTANPLTRGLTEMLRIVNDMFSANFNDVLVNSYQDGSDSISKHSDKHSSPTGVVVISYGAVRKFRIRDKDGIILDVSNASSSIVWMQGDFQKEFTHEIPVEKKVKTSTTTFTFRSL